MALAEEKDKRKSTAPKRATKAKRIATPSSKQVMKTEALQKELAASAGPPIEKDLLQLRSINSMAHRQATGRPARRVGMAQVIAWLAWMVLASILPGGCASLQGSQQDQTGVAAGSFARQLSVTEATVVRLGDGWDVGLQMVYSGQYLDDQGREQTGLMARISVGNAALGQVETIETRVGTVFHAGAQRYQVLQLKLNTSTSSAPGSSNGYMVIEQLEGEPAGTPEPASTGVATSTVE